MQPPALLLLTAAAIAAVGPASANLETIGPYGIRMEYYGKCDDGEYPAQDINMTRVWDEETQQTAFTGYFNRTYDDLEDDCVMQVSAYKWGSTGGWYLYYQVSFTKAFDFVKDHFPEIYKYMWYPLGWRKKPVPPGIYPFYSTMNKQITLTGFAKLAYGKYKIYVKVTKEGKGQTCVQFDAVVFEVVGDEAVITKSPFLGAESVVAPSTPTTR